MKITRMWRGRLCQKLPRRILLIMRFSIVLLFGVFLQVSASSLAQKVVFQKHQMTFKELFTEVESQTGLITIYSNSQVDMSEEVVLQVDEMELTELYQSLLTVKGLTFDLVDDYIVIKKESIDSKIIEEVQSRKKVLKGVVTDAENGQPLLGVNVALKGTAQGTITDENGTFIFEVEQENGTLVFSYIGYEVQEHSISSSKSYTIKLVPSVSSVDEVVVYVSGLTRISKERATGSYSVMSRSDILTSPNEEIGNSLEGNVAGLQENFNPQTGQMEIAIRGIGTINSEAKPLIVVDGFPVEGDFSTINPNDVESVTVLKDAAAASIWGARAGNGVIVITTRTAKKGEKIKIDFNSYIKIGEEFDFDYNLPRASVKTQLDFEKYLVDMNPNIYPGLVEDLTYGGTTRSKGQQAYFDYKRGTISKNDLDGIIHSLSQKHYQKDLQKYLLRRPVTQHYNLSISNRGERSSTYLSILYNNVKAVWKNNDDQKVLINFRNTYNVRDWLDFNVGMVTEIKKDDYSGANLGMLKQMSPYEELVNGDGSYAQVNYNLNYAYMNSIARSAEGMPYENWAYNPLEETLNREQVINYVNTRFQAGLAFKITDGLTYTPKFQYERFSSKQRIYNNENTFYVRNEANRNVEYDELTNTVSKQYVPSGGILWQRFNTTNTYDLRNQVNFDKVLFEDHEINLVAAVEHIWKVNNSFADQVYGHDDSKNTYADPPFGHGSSEVTIPSIFPGYTGSLSSGTAFGYNSTRLFSFYGNAAYTFKKRYTLTGSYRTDASNMIVDDPKFRYSPFWSVGGSWNVKNEDFLKNIKMVDRLVLRGTHGVSGNTVTTASTVPIISMYSYPSSQTGAYGGYVSDFGNPTLRWEKVNQTNLAIDFSMFNQWLNGTIEVYDKFSEDLLASVSIAPTYGSTSQMFNAAEVKNKGLELNLNSNMNFFENQLGFNTGFILSHNTSEVTSLQVAHIYPRSIGSTRYVEGDAVAPVYSWVYGGMNEENNPTILGENGITYTMNENIGSGGEKGEEVLKNMGTLIAPTSMGWNSTLMFKGITLRANVLGKFGHKFRRTSFDYNLSTGKGYYHEDLDLIMAGQADALGVPELPQGYEFYAYRWGWYTPELHTLVEDASHIRLKELYLGYELPQRLLSKTGIDKLRIYAHARNLGILWAANDKGIDPEYIKGSSYKPGPTYTFGLNVEF